MAECAMAADVDCCWHSVTSQLNYARSCEARGQLGPPAGDPHAAPMCRVMMIVAQEQAEEVRKREARREAARRQQAQAALEHSRLRQLRAQRLAGLKVSPPIRTIGIRHEPKCAWTSSHLHAQCLASLKVSHPAHACAPWVSDMAQMKHCEVAACMHSAVWPEAGKYTDSGIAGPGKAFQPLTWREMSSCRALVMS